MIIFDAHFACITLLHHPSWNYENNLGHPEKETHTDRHQIVLTCRGWLPIGACASDMWSPVHRAPAVACGSSRCAVGKGRGRGRGRAGARETACGVPLRKSDEVPSTSTPPVENVASALASDT